MDNRIALKAVALAGIHPDPADRIIVATAQSLGARLITSDRRLRSSPVVATIW